MSDPTREGGNPSQRMATPDATFVPAEVKCICKSVKPSITADPLGYGIKSSRKVLETVAEYVQEQGLTKERVKLEDVFWQSTLEL